MMRNETVFLVVGEELCKLVEVAYHTGFHFLVWCGARLW